MSQDRFRKLYIGINASNEYCVYSSIDTGRQDLFLEDELDEYILRSALDELLGIAEEVINFPVPHMIDWAVYKEKLKAFKQKLGRSE